jgi:hypothetical protein
MPEPTSYDDVLYDGEGFHPCWPREEDGYGG